MPDPIRCSTVEFSAATVRAVGGPTHATIPREQIRHIRLVYDTGARYPFAQFFLGFVLLALGAIGVLVLILTSIRGSLPISTESGELRFQLIPMTFWLMMALGLWLLIGIFRASYHLIVETDERVTKMLLGKPTDLPAIRQFIRRASWSFGYEIDTSVLDKMQVPS